MNRIQIVTGIALLCVAVPHALAAKKKDPFTGEVKIGVKYDSHLSVEDLDLELDQGDTAMVLGAKLQFRPVQEDRFDLKLGYAFNGSFYSDFDQFDLQTHRFNADASTKVGGARLGLDYSYNQIRLDNDGLLDMSMISPYASGFVADRLFLRVQYNRIEKDFDRLVTRDATGDQFGATLFSFFANPRGFFSVSARFDQEDAIDPALDYEGYQLGANLQLPFDFRGRDGKVNFGYSFRTRDYDNITPLIGARREEDRNVFNVTSELPITERMAVELEYRYVDRSSNFPAADYDEQILLAALTVKL